MANIPPFPPFPPGGGRLVPIGGGSVAGAKSQLDFPPPRDNRSKFFDLATGRWQPWIMSNISYESLPTELWIHIMTFLPYHSLKKLAMVNTYFLDLLESPVLDKNLFRKPYSNVSSIPLVPKQVELHPLLTDLGSHVGWKLKKSFYEISGQADPTPSRRQAPTTIFTASYLHQQQHPTYTFAPRWRNILDERRFFGVRGAYEPATYPPVQTLYLQFMSGMSPCLVKGSQKDGDCLAVGDVVTALANYGASDPLKMVVTMLDKAHGDEYVGWVVDDDLGPDSHLVLKAAFDLEEDGPWRFVTGRLDDFAAT